VSCEPAYPFTLSLAFDGMRRVGATQPAHSVCLGHPGEDGHTGQDRAGPPLSAVAADLDALSRLGLSEGSDDAAGGRFGIDRYAEVRPVDPLGGPGRLP